MNIFVGNLPFKATDLDVRGIFEAHGNVDSVVIVTEKNTAKSRGFGFVEMPNEQQAQTAIAALNGTELMGRPLNVSPARSKPSQPRQKKEQREFFPKIETEDQPVLPAVEPKGDVLWDKPAVKRTGGYKAGRRSRSFMARQGRINSNAPVESGKKSYGSLRPWAKKEAELKPRQKRESGSKTWQRNEGSSKPWQKKEDGSKPWQKREDGAKPWLRSEGQSKPWQRSESGSKPWQKREGGAKPWQRSEGNAKPWQKKESGPQSWPRSEGPSKPWQKREGGAKPWQKKDAKSVPWYEKAKESKFKKRSPRGGKPWQKSAAGKPQSRFRKKDK